MFIKPPQRDDVEDVSDAHVASAIDVLVVATNPASLSAALAVHQMGAVNFTMSDRLATLGMMSLMGGVLHNPKP